MMKSGAYLGFISAFMILALAGCAVFSSDSDSAATDQNLAADQDLSNQNPHFASSAEDSALVAPQDEEGQEEEIAEDENLEEGDLDEKAKSQQQVDTVVAKFIAEGKECIENGALDDAQEKLAHALELDPGCQEARELFNHVSAMLGQRSDSVASIAADVRDKAVVRKAQNRIKAEELIKAAQVYMDAGDYEKAIRSYENALLIVRWNPYLEEDGAIEESALQASLENAKAKLDRQRREQEAELRDRIYKQQQEEEKREREALESSIAALFNDANNAFLQDRYKECELYLDKLLKIDPNNTMAIDLKALSMRTRHTATQEDLRKNYKRQWRATFDDLEYDDLPQLDLIVYPDDEEWKRISNQGRSVLARAEGARSAEDEAIFQKLATTPVAANFEQASLEEVVEYFKATTGVNFLISQTIIESGEEPLFDLVTPPKPAFEQLELLLVDLALPPLKYKIDNGVVWILSEEDPSGEYILDVYDIRDLAKIIQNFPARDFNLTPSKAVEEYEEPDPQENPDIIAADTLIDLVQANIEPSSWENAENTIAAIGSFLVVRQSKRVHEKINQLLQDLRSSAGVLINIETRFIAVEDNFLEDIGVDFRGLDGNINDFANPLAAVPNVLLDDFGDGSVEGGFGSESDPDGLGTGNDAGIYYDDGGDGDLMGRLENLLDTQLGETDILDNAGGTTIQFTFLDDVQMEAILRAVSKSSTSNIIQAPSLTVYNGERASLTFMEHVSYVKDFEPEIAQSAVIAEPIVAVARDGVILDVRPVVSSDRRFITMELRPTVAILQRDESGDLPQFTTGLGVGESVTIELPELEVKRLRTTVTMPDGATLLLGGMKISNETKFDTGLPFFNKIPILSFFLSRKAEYRSKRKLLILVTANIVIPEEIEPVIGINR